MLPANMQINHFLLLTRRRDVEKSAGFDSRFSAVFQECDYIAYGNRLESGVHRFVSPFCSVIALRVDSGGTDIVSRVLDFRSVWR